MKNAQPEKCNENRRDLLDIIKEIEIEKDNILGAGISMVDSFPFGDFYHPSGFFHHPASVYAGTVYFAKIKEDAKIPSKDVENGCYDVYACFDSDYMVIEPGEVVMVPTGIASAFDSSYRIGLRERGSTGSKGLSLRAGQIDSGYRGEWFVAINNTTNKPIVIAKYPKDFNKKKVTIYPYHKAICQAALEIVPEAHIVELPLESLKEIPSERGEGKLGSSNK